MFYFPIKKRFYFYYLIKTTIKNKYYDGVKIFDYSINRSNKQRTPHQKVADVNKSKEDTIRLFNF